jgi:hypothetical protein
VAGNGSVTTFQKEHVFLMITSCSCLYLLLCVALILIGEVCLAFYYFCNVVSEEQCKWQSCVVCLSVCLSVWVGVGWCQVIMSVRSSREKSSYRARNSSYIARKSLHTVWKHVCKHRVPFPPGNWWFAKAILRFSKPFANQFANIFRKLWTLQYCIWF